jgi:hypothetical protein
MRSKMNLKKCIQLNEDTSLSLSRLHRVTGLPVDTIVIMALLDWEDRHMSGHGKPHIVWQIERGVPYSEIFNTPSKQEACLSVAS